jgi:glycine cleavage system transcriptional repressor
MASGRDRPGIVDRISGAIFNAGCNLEDSRMAILGGEFALIVLITGAEEALARARVDLEDVGREMDLTLQTKPTALPPASGGMIAFRVHAVAMDHPGIVHRVTRALRERGINVARLDTRLSHAPISGTPVFSLEMEVQVPVGLSIPRLRAELNELAEAANIDITLSPVD